MKEKNLDWDTINKAVLNLAQQIKQNNEKFDWIISVNRGGLIPGVLLSHALSIKNHGVATVTNYEDNGDKRKSIQKDVYVSCRGMQFFKGKALIVDDVIRTGETMSAATEIVAKDRDIKTIKTLSLFRSTDNEVIAPNYCYEEIPKDTWMGLPWEKGGIFHASKMPELQL